MKHQHTGQRHLRWENFGQLFLCGSAKRRVTALLIELSKPVAHHQFVSLPHSLLICSLRKPDDVCQVLPRQLGSDKEQLLLCLMSVCSAGVDSASCSLENFESKLDVSHSKPVYAWPLQRESSNKHQWASVARRAKLKRLPCCEKLKKQSFADKPLGSRRQSTVCRSCRTRA